MGPRRGRASAGCSPGARGREARTRRDLPPRRCRRFQLLSPKVSRTAGSAIPSPSSARVTRVLSPSCSMVAATRLAPPRREFCSVSVKISARPAENSRVTLSMALSPTRAWIVAELLPASAVAAFCAVDMRDLLVVDTGTKTPRRTEPAGRCREGRTRWLSRGAGRPVSPATPLCCRGHCRAAGP